MNIQEVILKNEQSGEDTKNKALVLGRIKELVDKYPEDVTELLHKTGVPVSCVLPKEVIRAVLVKHLATNPELREAVAKTILEMDSFLSADGKGLAVAGGVMSALGSVLSGISRSQNYSTETNVELQREKERLESQVEREEQRRRRNTLLIAGGAILVIAAIIIGFRSKAGKEKLKTAVA